jgi:hypothetical protein
MPKNKYAEKEPELLEIDRLLDKSMEKIIQRNKEQIRNLNNAIGVSESLKIYKNGKITYDKQS